MTCKDFIDFLMDYLEKQLPDGSRDEFEKHIEDCPDCLHYLDSYKSTVELGQNVCKDDDSAPEDAPEKLIQAILSAVKEG
jgi:anti-sigma factor (TIGR02949 family)